jgi:hypothetical protein
MDSEKLFSYRSNPEVAKYQLWKPVKLSEEVFHFDIDVTQVKSAT